MNRRVIYEDYIRQARLDRGESSDIKYKAEKSAKRKIKGKCKVKTNTGEITIARSPGQQHGIRIQEHVAELVTVMPQKYRVAITQVQAFKL